MKNLFIGFIFVFLDFNLNISNSKIGLIPDFIGYLIIINGLMDMSEESTRFIKVMPLRLEQLQRASQNSYFF
jgi:hypothetical protein